MNKANSVSLIATLVILSQPLFAQAAVDQNICQNLADENCVVAGEELTNNNGDTKIATMLAKEDTQTPELKQGRSTEKDQKYLLSKQAVDRVVNTQKRSDELVKQMVRINPVQNDQLKVILFGTANRK